MPRSTLSEAANSLADGAAGEAEKQFREVLSREAANPSALAGLAHALLMQSKFSQARQAANASVGLKPSAEAYVVLARVDLHDLNNSAAGENLRKALALEPNNEDGKALALELQSSTTDSKPDR